MTQPKVENFTESQQSLALIGKALSHPARIAILQHLAKVGTCISGDIALELPLARATVSQHLSELKEAGLITGTIDGLKVCYCLNKMGITKLLELVTPFVGELTACCSTEECC